MKKSITVAWIGVLALIVLITAGCGAKDKPAASDEPSSSPSASSEPEGSKPSVTSTPSQEPSSPESADVSASPSAKPSAEVSAKPSPSEAPKSGKDYASLGFDLMENDGLGSLKYRMSESDLVALLGEPDSKSDAEVWGADGLEHSTWSYTSKGLDIGMAKLPDDPEAHIFSLTAVAPCDLATKRGIKIGSSKDDVLKAYKNEIDLDANDDTDSWITVGSAYGGIGLGIENGAVTYIFIGASAE